MKKESDSVKGCIRIHPDANNITASIIGCAYTIGNSLGCGFLEKVYENALVHELAKHGFKVDQQCAIKVRYDDVVVGDYVADLVVEGSVLIELKTVKFLDDVHVAQCLNYLKATGMHVCLLLNFGLPRVEVRRLIL